MAEIKIDGYLQVKEDGLRAWIWSKRYVVLREQTITFHRNEVKIEFFIFFFYIEINPPYYANLMKKHLANWTVRSACLFKRDYHRDSFRVKVSLL